MTTQSTPSPPHFSDPEVIALQTAFRGREPFYSGTCAIPGYQHLLYYTHNNDVRCINVSHAGMDDLENLYQACSPAKFGRNGENVLDASYRKAGEMNLTSFATLFDPRSLGIHEQVSKALLTESLATMNMELYKLNVYGKGDFFKAHKDTPRNQEMFGSLVVVLPVAHEGGQLVLRHAEKEWSIDFADRFAAATEPSVCFVAFYCDVEHEVLPITSGYRITLTYNLYHKQSHPYMSIPTPFHLELKQALANLVNDKSKLPDGGYLGFGLAHEYVHTGSNLLELVPNQLKGSDRTLADVCDELGLRYSIRLLYRGIVEPWLNLIATKELDVWDTQDMDYANLSSDEYLRVALEGLTIEEVEGVNFGGGPAINQKFLELSDLQWLGPFYRNRVTEVLEITPMNSSVNIKSLFMTYGNESELEHFYGTACMLVAVGPADSRKYVE